MPGVVPASDQWKSIDAAAALSKRYSGEPMPKRLVSEMGCVMVVFASFGGPVEVGLPVLKMAPLFAGFFLR
jgi:hypothetical protein